MCRGTAYVLGSSEGSEMGSVLSRALSTCAGFLDACSKAGNEGARMVMACISASQPRVQADTADGPMCATADRQEVTQSKGVVVGRLAAEAQRAKQAERR
eukprot:comp9551_c0_seq1/m.4574 comp9551_c0_seq1/g.4574  ORF comp9551_c0_seq1/g.4574 comp9551_c0_seq1/m.4574 type:complete len:100 (+) comp9551_c0_seq1:361-660(+)